MPENGKRVLIIEDEPGVVEMYKKRLEVAGYAVMVATDGREGLERFRAEIPDLVILDIMMPKLNGYEVCKMLKGDTRYRQVPIIMLSALDQEGDEKIGMECGADAYLTKPCPGKVLLAKMQALLAGPQPLSPAQA